MGKSLAAGVVALAMLLAVQPAIAEMEDIVVEAQRRAENLQDVPLAVSAFQGDAIERLQIATTQDIGDAVPNLQTYPVTANAAAMQLHMRGASVQNPGFNVSESPVGLYVDDVYRGRLATANLDLTDIERIEVLRGPQATLYGRNTLAGAIKIITRTPADEFWADASLGFGNYETSRLTASIGGPLKPGALAGSLALSYHDRGEGYFENPLTGARPGEYTNQAARAKLHWYGNDRIQATVSAFYVDVENDGYNGVPYRPFDGPGAVPGEPLSGFYDSLSPEGVNFGASDQAGVTVDLRVDLGALELRSITAWVDIDDRFGFDLAGGGFLGVPGLPGLLIDSRSGLQQWSQELQLIGSAFDERLDWITGFFFLDEDGDQIYSGTAAPFFGFREDTSSETRSYALFAEARWHFSERLSGTLGGRWTRDEKQYRYRCTSTQFAGCAPADGAAAPAKDFDEFTPRIGLEYRPGDDWLLYASLASGFQAGGFQTLCFGNVLCAGQVYDPQKVWSGEFGVKSELLDKRLRLNMALFYAAYEDLQQAIGTVVNGQVIFPTGNVGDVDVRGLELEAAWTPVDALNLFATLGFMDADKVEFDDPVTGPVVRELPSNPELTLRAGFDYRLSLAPAVDLSFGADLNYVDDYFSEVTNELPIESYTRINGFIGIGGPDQRWQLVASGRNLSGEEDNVSGLFFSGNTNIRTVLPPREYLLTLKLNY
ncbi:MAG: TonB-dependent receptor [Gammaproteobacteria bacterium]|nr:MAG: TonB-dependent receptor [Gammaproteobacteria bacterium]